MPLNPCALILIHGPDMTITINNQGTTPEPTPARLTGDVNNDGNVDIVDGLLTAQYYAGLNPPNFDITVADVNCDEGVDIVDALLIAQYYVGLISQFC